MYNRLKNSKIKVIHSDGSGWSITQGILIDYDEKLHTLRVHDDKKGHDIYINALKIHKLEVLNDNSDMSGDIVWLPTKN